MIPLILMAMMKTEPEPLSPGDTNRTLSVAGVERSYLVHVPAKYDPAKPTPVVLIFHGGGSNVEAMVRFCGLSEKADQEGFLAVYPRGTGRVEKFLTFNGGNCCGHAMRRQVDDIRFVRSLLDDLESVANVDRRRVFATGMSNGAIMAYRAASEISDRIAAIAPVAGPMGTDACRPQRAVPVMHFHGDDDQFAPLAGGRGARSVTQTEFYSVAHTIGCWVKANGCQAEGRTTELPRKVDDETSVTKTVYSGGRNGAEVVLVVVKGGGHTWPGRPVRIPRLGRSTSNISANDMMWEFFQRRPMPSDE